MYTTDGSIILGEERVQGEITKQGTRVSYRGIADETKTHAYEIRVLETGETWRLIDHDIHTDARPVIGNYPTLAKLERVFQMIGAQPFLARDSQSWWQIKNALDAIDHG